MSTKGTIAGIETEGMFVHLYNECSDGNPQPVYIEMWEQGENTNHTMVVCMPQDKALELADDMAMWAKSIREFNAKEKP